MKKELITEINRYKEIMGINNINIINEAETKVLDNYKGDILNGPKYHQSRALGNWQSDNAWDLFAPAGTQWYSLTKGIVSKIKKTGKTTGKVYGTQVTVKGEDGYPDIFYTHLKNVQINVGDKMDIGEKIGEVSEWGKSKGTHIHVGLPYNKHIKNLLSADYSEFKDSTKTNSNTTSVSSEKIDKIKKDINTLNKSKQPISKEKVELPTNKNKMGDNNLTNTLKLELDKINNMSNPGNDLMKIVKDELKKMKI